MYVVRLAHRLRRRRPALGRRQARPHLPRHLERHQGRARHRRCAAWIAGRRSSSWPTTELLKTLASEDFSDRQRGPAASWCSAATSTRPALLKLLRRRASRLPARIAALGRCSRSGTTRCRRRSSDLLQRRRRRTCAGWRPRAWAERQAGRRGRARRPAARRWATRTRRCGGPWPWPWAASAPPAAADVLVNALAVRRRQGRVPARRPGPGHRGLGKAGHRASCWPWPIPACEKDLRARRRGLPGPADPPGRRGAAGPAQELRT